MSSDDGPIEKQNQATSPAETLGKDGAKRVVSAPIGTDTRQPLEAFAMEDVDPLDEEIDASRWDNEPSRRDALQRTVVSASGKAIRDTSRAVRRTTKLLYRSLQRSLPAIFDTDYSPDDPRYDGLPLPERNLGLENRGSRFQDLRLAGDWTMKRTLDDGPEVTFRPLQPADREYLLEGFMRLSPESRYQRFMTAMDTLPDAYLGYLTEIDQVHHFAVVAYTPDPARMGERGLGVARFIELPDVENEAELAITIADEAQGIGLGVVFMNILIAAAAERGFTALRAEVLPDNAGMQRLTARFGGERIAVEEGVVTWRVPVPPSDTIDFTRFEG